MSEERRFNTVSFVKTFKEKSLKEKLLFWKDFYIIKHLEIFKDSYEKADYKQVLIQSENSFKIRYEQSV